MVNVCRVNPFLSGSRQRVAWQRTSRVPPSPSYIPNSAFPHVSLTPTAYPSSSSANSTPGGRINLAGSPRRLFAIATAPA